ncbi:MAG: alpha/beta hydrolase [Chitinophagaceae bacterium]|nr:alpha/beta hydrolase [Chitinophagaceae bacterium]
MRLFKLLLIFLFTANVVIAQKDSGFISSFDGVKIYYESEGTGYPVVLVHGFINNSSTWKRTQLYTDLLKKGHRVILMDMRGNGKSDKPHIAASYQNDAEAKDIMLLLDKLAIKEYSVVGYSRGSIITARLLLLDKRINKAVLGGMGDGFTDPEWPRRKLFYRALSGEVIPELEGMVKYVKGAGVDQQALALLQKEQPSTVPTELATIKKPVLIISGDNDTDNGSPQTLSKMISNSIFKQVPGDHNTTLRTPAFSEAVIEFINALK